MPIQDTPVPAPTVPPSASLSLWQSNLPETILLLLTWAFRLTRLDAIPIFWDEAFHIWNARIIPLGLWWSPIQFGRWLNVYLISLFDPFGEESLWVARTVTVLLSVGTGAACIGLGRLLDSRRTGRLAGLLYLVLPYAFFYDRQALSDAVMAAFGALALVMLVRLYRRPQAGYALLAGGFLAASALSKFSGALHVGMPAVAAACFAPGKRNWKSVVGYQAMAAAVALGLIAFTLIRANQVIAASSGGSVIEPWRWCHSPQCGGELEPSQNMALIKTNLKLYAERIPAYWGYPFFIAALATIAFGRRDRLRERACLWVPAFGLVVPFILTADLFPGSYLTYTLAPMTVLAAMSVQRALDWLTHRFARLSHSQALPRLSAAVLLGVLMVPSAFVEYQFAFDYESAPWLAQERGGYSFTWSGWRAAMPAGRALLDLQKSSGRRFNLIAVGGASPDFTSWWGGRRGGLEEYTGTADQRERVATWLAAGDDVYFVDELSGSPLPADAAASFGVVLAPAGDFADPQGPAVVRLWRVAGTSPELSYKISGWIFGGNPGGLRDFYPVFADSLADLPARTPIVLYPPHQQSILSEYLDPARAADTVALGYSWPVHRDDIESQLDALARAHSRLVVLFWQETSGDPNRTVEIWLNEHLFKIQEQWFGPLRRVDYATYVLAGEPKSIDAQFGDVVQLRRVGLYDPVAEPGSAIRLRLEWQPLKKIEQSYKVFAHVFSQGGQFAAQHDGVPMGDLAPTNTWAPGQAVIDQFAISLPPDLPTGRYLVRIGLYDIAAQTRLPLSDGNDFVIVGEFEVP